MSTVILPSQVQRLQPHVEIAPGADLSAHPSTWTWVDLTNRSTPGSRTLLIDQGLSIQQGRADESSQTQPGSVSFTFDNPDGALTPDNPLSPWWPALDVGTPARVSIDGGSPHLQITGQAGARARTPDHPSLDVTDLFVAVDAVLPVWRAPSSSTWKIIGRYSTAQRAWQAHLDGAGRIGVFWSTNGLASGEHELISTVPLRPPLSGRLAFAIHLDVNVGGTSHVATFYQAATLAELLADPAAAVIDQETGVGTTSIFPGSSPLDIGDVSGSGFAVMHGAVRAAVVRNGDATGPLVADPNFAAQPVGATSFPDSTGKVWTVSPPAAVTNRQTRLVGQVDEIAPSWPHGDLSTADHPGDARVDLTVSGVLRRLTQGAKPLNSSIYRLVTAPFNIGNVLAYWPLEDGSDASSAASPIPGVPPLTIGGEFRFAGDTEPFAGSAPLVNISGGQPAGWNGTIPAPPSPLTNWAVEWFVKIPTKETDPTSTVLGLVYTSGTVRRWRFAVSSTNVTVRGYDVDGTQIVTASLSSAGFATTPVGIRFQVTQVGGNVDWDFSFWEVGVGTFFGTDGSVAGTVGRPTKLSNLIVAPPDGMSIGHMIVTVDRAAGWISPADEGWAGEPAAERYERLCDEEGIAVLIHGDPSDSEAMGPQRPLALPDLLQECATADMGIECEQRHTLGLAYRTRRSLYNQTPIVLDAARNEITTPLQPKRDDQRLRNDVTAKRENGSSYRVVDPDVESRKKPRYDDEATVNVARDDQLPGQAGWRYHLGTWSLMRVSNVSIELTAAPHLFDTWLDWNPGDRLQVEHLPPQYPAETIDLLTEGWSEAISGARWTPALNCSPGGPWDVGVLDGDGTPDTSLPRFDTDGSALDVTIDQDDLSWTVDVTDGPLWTTDPAYFPLEVEIGGEVIRLASISGASSPQTFTAAARAVNGIRKAHPAGTPVRVADPFRLAL